MPKLATPLSENQIATLAPRLRGFAIGDGGGLYLQIEPSGKKLWRMKYKRGTKETSISFGPYPDISLTEARHLRENARRLIAEGADPVDQRREQAQQARKSPRPKLRMAMRDDGSLTIEKPSGRLTLSPSQVAALRAFLIAADDTDTGASTCQN